MENNKAKSFELKDQFGNIQKLEDYRGQKILLYFYPKDMTPGCTLEAQGFQERYKEFVLHNIQILGISKDSEASHKKFCDNYHLEFPLLSDPEGKMCEDYGVWKEKSMFGKKYMGISRESFLVNEQGIVMKHWENVKPIEHPQEVLDYINELR